MVDFLDVSFFNFSLANTTYSMIKLYIELRKKSQFRCTRDVKQSETRCDAVDWRHLHQASMEVSSLTPWPEKCSHSASKQ